jgi:hypothetical protein
MKVIRALFVVVVLALAGGVTFRAAKEASRNREAIAGLVEQRAQLDSLTSRLDARNRAANAALASLTEKLARTPESKDQSPAASGSEPVNTSTRRRGVEVQAVIARDPQKAADYSRNTRVRWDLHHASMAEALGLSPEQIEKMKAWADSSTGRRMDVIGALETHGLDPNPNGETFKTLETQMRGGASPAEFLAEKASPWLEYLSRRLIVMLFHDLAGFAIYSGESITSTQVEEAAKILAAHSTGRIGANRVDPATINWPAARSQLAGVLSPTQIATLGDRIESSEINRKMNAREALLTEQFKRRQRGDGS